MRCALEAALDRIGTHSKALLLLRRHWRIQANGDLAVVVPAHAGQVGLGLFERHCSGRRAAGVLRIEHCLRHAGARVLGALPSVAPWYTHRHRHRDRLLWNQ